MRRWRRSGARGARLGVGDKAAAEATAGIVKHLAYVDAAREELVARRIDVVNRQDRAVDRARRLGGDPAA